MNDTTARDEVLEVANGTETLQGANLQASIDALLAMAHGLDVQLAAATGVQELQAIAAAQADLNNQALTLVTAQVGLLAGEARVTAENIDAATRYANEAIGSMVDWRGKIAAVGKVIDFFGAVLSGNGTKMVEAAIRLKSGL